MPAWFKAAPIDLYRALRCFNPTPYMYFFNFGDFHVVGSSPEVLVRVEDNLMIGKVLWQEFFNNRDWPVASALAVVMLAILIVPIILFNRSQAKEMEGKI